MNRNDIVTNGKLSGIVIDLDFARNEIKVAYTMGTEKQFEYEGQIVSPMTGKELWTVVTPYIAKKFDGGRFVLFTEQNKQLYFWQGQGYYSQNPELAKEYNDADVAQNQCERMRRRRLKFCTLSDLVRLHDGKIAFENEVV